MNRTHAVLLKNNVRYEIMYFTIMLFDLITFCSNSYVFKSNVIHLQSFLNENIVFFNFLIDILLQCIVVLSKSFLLDIFILT